MSQNYVDICNWAKRAIDDAEAMLGKLTDAEIRELQEIVAEEAEADKGRSLTVAIVKSVVDAEAAYRKKPA